MKSVRMWTRLLIPAVLASVTACAPEDGSSEDPMAEIGEPEGSEPAVIDPNDPIPEAAPIQLLSITYYDKVTASWKTVPKINGLLTWPSPFDIPPPQVYFVWKLAGDLADADISNIVSQRGYALEFFVNGIKLLRGPDANSGNYYTSAFPGGTMGCPEGTTCLGTNVYGPAMLSIPFIWNVKLDIWATRTATIDKKSALYKVYPNPNATTYFEFNILPIFRSDRCSNCHNLSLATKLTAQHEEVYPNTAEFSSYIIVEKPSPRGTRLGCTWSCHDLTGSNSPVSGETFNETEWMTPKYDMGLNWGTMFGAEICETVKANLPTASLMQEHFFEDARIAWAVHDGYSPFGDYLGKAPPGDFYEFVERMSIWIDNGAPCP
jgi:hypothetical protein